MFYSSLDFPNSYTSPFFITSPQTPFYNCIAWAFGDPTKPYWPSDYWYWPNNISKSERLDSFIELFNLKGFENCTNGILEPGIEKIVIFGLDKLNTKHAAKQLPDGQWSSKLGQNYDVSHTIKGISGGLYGEVQQFMSRAAP